jgi:hypothetical protein
MTPFDRARPGGTLSAAEFNRVMAYVERSTRITADAGIEAVRDETGYHLRLAAPALVLTKVTSSSGSPPAHAWTEQILVSGTATDKNGGMFGTTSFMPLYEPNGGTIANGSIVTATRGQGQFYQAVGTIKGGCLSVSVCSGGSTSTKYLRVAPDGTLSLNTTPC